MISLSSPVPPAPHSRFGVGGFREALDSLNSKGLLPTSLSSDQIASFIDPFTPRLFRYF